MNKAQTEIFNNLTNAEKPLNTRQIEMLNQLHTQQVQTIDSLEAEVLELRSSLQNEIDDLKQISDYQRIAWYELRK